MPLIENNPNQLQVLGDINPINRPEPKEELGFFDRVGLEFQTETITGSAYAHFNAGNGVEYQEDPSYSSLSDENIKGYEMYSSSFIDIQSKEHSDAMKLKIDEEVEIRRSLEGGGAMGVFASFTAQLIDPVNLGMMFVPGLNIARGASLAKSTGMMAAGGFISSTATELALHGTQETRTLEQSVIDVTASTFLSGILGAGMYGLSKKQFNELADDVQTDFSKNTNPSAMSADGIHPRHASAAQTILTTLEDESMQGSKKAANLISFATPVARVMHNSKSVEAKRTVQELTENAFYTNKNNNGVATSNAVESFIKVRENTARFEVVTATQDAFKKYSKQTPANGTKLTNAEFREEIGKALRLNDNHAIPEVMEAAAVYRKNLDSLKDDAIEVGLLPEDVKATGSESYFTRVYAPEVIQENYTEFVEIITDHLSQGASKAGKGHKKTLEANNTKIDEINVLIKGVEVDKLSKNELIDTLDGINNLVPNSTGVIGRKATTKELKEALKGALVKAESHKNKLLTKRSSVGDDLAKGNTTDFNVMARDVVDNILGNGGRFDFSQLPKDVVGKAGAFKERTLNIDDTLIEKFLINDAEYVFNVHARQTIPQIELARKFGRVDMKDQIEAIRDEYSTLITKAANKTERQALEKDLSNSIRDIQGVRDILLGNYKRPTDPNSIISRAGRGARDLNFITLLGGMTLSAIPDIGRHIMVNGWSRNAKALKAALTSFNKLKLARKDLQKMGVAVDITLASRANAIADIDDLVMRKSGIEKGLKWSTGKMGALTLMNYWNDTMKTFAGLVVQDRIIDGAIAASKGSLKASEARKLAQLGFDTPRLKAISEQFSKHGETVDGLKTSKSHLWDDAELKAEFQASLMKDIDSIIITPGAGDKPLMMHSEIGKTIGQFKSFMFASGNRATIAGFQQNDFAAYSGMAVMLGLGSLTYAIKAKIAGREVDLSPERLIREGFDRSGLLGVLGEINGITEGISRGNLGLHVLSGGKPLSRYQQRNMMGNLLGPSFGKGQDIFNVAGAVSTGDFNKGSINSAKRMIPFQNLFYIQGLISAVDKK